MPNKAQFIDSLAERLDGDRKRAAAALEAVIDSVYAAISRGERVAISGFGVFERRDRKARTARNPATGARVDVGPTRVPAFRPGAEFKAIASGARDVMHERTERAQAAVGRATGAVRERQTKAAARVKEAGDRAQAAVQDAVEAVREAPAKAAAAVKKSPAGKKAAKKASKATAPAKSAVNKAAKDVAKKTAPAKKAAKKTTKKAAAKAPAKKAAAKKTTAKKTTAAKKTAKKAAKKAPAKKK